MGAANSGRFVGILLVGDTMFVRGLGVFGVMGGPVHVRPALVGHGLGIGGTSEQPRFEMAKSRRLVVPTWYAALVCIQEGAGAVR